MTDLEKLKTLFNDFGIEFKINEVTPKYSKHLEIGEGIGYVGFCCSFYFDENGKFIEYGVYE